MINKSIFCVSLVISAAFLQGCVTPPETSEEYINCDEDQTKKIDWALAYMRAAAKSSTYRRCLKTAIEGSWGPGNTIWGGGKALHTQQESTHIGPYLPCAVASSSPLASNFREPEFVYQDSPFEYQNRLLAYEAALTISQGEASDNLEITCDNTISSTALTPAGADHGYFPPQHDSPYRWTNQVHLGSRMFTQFPNHQTEDYGEAERFQTLTPAYPIDEISGIILHEIFHNYGFEHGTSGDNECGYTEGYDIGRFHSLNEIVEGCMSEVVEGSIALCTEQCSDANALPIVTNPQAVTSISLSHECICTPVN